LCAVQQQNARALGDFLVFLTRIASVPKFGQKLAAAKWTSALLKMVGYDPDSGECYLRRYSLDMQASSAFHPRLL